VRAAIKHSGIHRKNLPLLANKEENFVQECLTKTSTHGWEFPYRRRANSGLSLGTVYPHDPATPRAIGLLEIGREGDRCDGASITSP
jgi:hypothetical protein